MAYEFSKESVARLARNVRRLEHLSRNAPPTSTRFPLSPGGATLNLAVSLTTISTRVGNVLGSGRATFLLPDSGGNLTADEANVGVKVWNSSSSVIVAGIHGFVFSARGQWVFVPLDCTGGD